MFIAVLDIETTDLDNKIGSIVEIGIALLDLRNGEITKIFDSLILEENTILSPDSWIFQNSQLKIEDVKTKGKTLEICRKPLQDIFNRYHVTCFNKKFDLGYMKARNFVFPKELDDPMLILDPIMKIPSVKYGTKYPSVKEALDYFKITGLEPHRACEDAVLEAKIVYQLYCLGYYEDEDERQAYEKLIFQLESNGG